jgi:DNA invertase Pin-like site-specific DNA recombinase
MAIIGYARTSTRDQEAGLQAQIRDLIAAGCAERDIYTEQASSVRERPELDLLRRRILRPGDELVVTRLDRLARSARDTLALAEELGQRGVTLRILDPAMTIGHLVPAENALGWHRHDQRCLGVPRLPHPGRPL